MYAVIALYDFQFEKLEAGDDCLLECGPDKTCHVDTCCARSNKTTQAIQPKQRSPTPSLRQRSTVTNDNEQSPIAETIENKV